jgi:hypothetical protein
MNSKTLNGSADQEQNNKFYNRSTEIQLVVGAQHIRSKIKHARNNNYTFTTALNELVDYPILIANRVDIILQKNGEGTGLYKIQISDDCLDGFEHILDKGSKNPFNFGYETEDHDNDDTISEFGTGMKQAAVSIGDRFTVITKVEDSYFLIQFEYQEMMREPDVMKSYNPTSFRMLSREEYKQYHPYEQGSTLILESVLQNVLSSASIESLEENIQESLSKTYSKILFKRKKDLILTLNGEQILENEDIYSTDECRPFTIQNVIIIKKDLKGDPVFLEYSVNEEDKKKYRFYKDTGVYKIVKGKELENLLKLPDFYKNGKISYKNIEGMIRITGTGTQFSSKINDANLPKGKTDIYRNGRHQGCLSTGSVNGAKNYVKTELEYNNKCLGKQYGTNYNKTINFKKDTLFTKATHESIKNLMSLLEYDTSTKKAEKFYLKALDFNIEVPESKTPTRYKTQGVPIESVSNDLEIVEQYDGKKTEESKTLTDVEVTSQHALAEELGIGEGASDDNETITGEPVEEPVEEPADEPVEEPADEPVEEPADEPVEEVADEPVEEVADESVEELADEPVEESTNEPAEEPLEEELVDTTRQPRNVLNYRTGPMKIHEMISAVEKLLNFLKTKNKQDDITNKKILKTINNVNNIEEILNNLNN